MANIKLSLIVPIYNPGIYIKRCLDSLLQQTLKNIKLISHFKLFMIKCVNLLYCIGLVKFFINLYVFLICKLKIDIKW